MRNDLKIGILLGIGLIAVVMIYFVGFKPSGPAENADGEAGVPSFGETADGGSGGEANIVIAPQDSDDFEFTIDDTDGGFSGEGGYYATRDGGSDQPPIYDPGTMPDGGTGSDPDDFYAGTTDPDEGFSIDPDEGTQNDGSRIGPVTGPTPPTGETRIYTVTVSDTGGFSGIAEDQYGSARYWPLIAEANPGVDSSRLREGMQLVLPPKPVETSGPREVDNVDLQPGERIYVVTDQDGGGLWGIAQKMYNGEGKHWTLIAEANPGVDTTRLRPGMRLIIPPLPQPEFDRVETPDIDLEPGWRTYTVTAADTGGYWSVAKNVYGQGSLHYVIANANPDIESTQLREGMILVIPPKPAVSSPPAGTNTVPDNYVPAEVPAGRPRFD